MLYINDVRTQYSLNHKTKTTKCTHVNNHYTNNVITHILRLNRISKKCVQTMLFINNINNNISQFKALYNKNVLRINYTNIKQIMLFKSIYKKVCSKSGQNKLYNNTIFTSLKRVNNKMCSSKQSLHKPRKSTIIVV